MTQLRAHLQERREVETFSQARIQPMGDGVQVTLRIARQICSLRQILAQEAIGILVGSTLPRAVRIGKEDLDREPLGQALMLRHLFAPLVGQRLAQRGRYVSEFFRETRSGTPRIRPLPAGRAAIAVMFGMWPRRSVPRDRGRRALRA
jgi:hypothetical protein